MYKALDVLAKEVKIKGIFSDWPATVSFYANCMGLDRRPAPVWPESGSIDRTFDPGCGRHGRDLPAATRGPAPAPLAGAVKDAFGSSEKAPRTRLPLAVRPSQE